jgi:Glycine-rich domain-containing protein-like
MAGTGYGDRGFSWPCHGTGNVLSHEVLAVDRFKRDIESLRYRDFPMGGTILTPSTGIPDGATADNWDNRFNTFPNRLLKTALLDEVSAVLRGAEPRMEHVKRVIENAIKDKEKLKTANTHKTTNGTTVAGSGLLAKQERMAVRKMMSCYWENSSIFALELGGAVVRQSVFVDKMCDIDWLHSPNARGTMERLIEKYKRFMTIISENRKRTAVPTLDVDLAWHTHQLSPKPYYEYSVRKCRKFVNHDDKLEEDKLATGFEWTSKMYQKMFHEVYSECTCWYCESKLVLTTQLNLY